MGTRKTAEDIRLEDEAHEINGGMLGTGISVFADGRAGPFALMVRNLNRAEVDRLIPVVLAELGREPAARRGE